VRFDNLRAYGKHIQSASPDHLMSVYLLISKNDHDLAGASKSLINSIFPDGKYSEMQVKPYSAENTQVQDILNELNTISIFAKKRIIIYKNIDRLNKDATATLESYFENPNPDVHFVLTAQSVNKGTKFYKKAEKQGVILDVPEEKAWQREKSVIRWLHEKINADGRQAEPRVVEVLVKQVGTEQNLLEQEIQKIYCYLGERTSITLQDVAAISSSVNVDSIWQLGESIFSFNLSEAMKCMKSNLEDGAPLLGLLRQLRSQYQTQLQICTILSTGLGKDEIVKHFRYLTGNILNKKIQEAQSYGLNRFKRGILQIDETELKIKSSAANLEFLAEMLIIKLATK